MGDFLLDLQHRMHMRKIPGLSIRLAQKNQVLFSKEFGVSNLSSGKALTSHHLFKVGCLTKPIVAQAVLHVICQGWLDSKEQAATYIPELRLSSELCKINISHLLNHTSGLPRGPYLLHASSDEETLLKITSSRLLFTPGESFKYSNFGYYLLGKIIERITDKAVEAYISDEIFKAYGMTHSRFSLSDPTANGYLATGYWSGWYFGSPNLNESSMVCPSMPLPNAAAGIISNADDYMDWLSGCEFKESIHGDCYPVNSTVSICSGWFVEQIGDLSYYYFSGSNSGFSGFMFMIPELSLAGVAFCNQGSCHGELREILYQACQASLGNKALPRFGRQEESINVLAGNRNSAVRFQEKRGQPPTFTLGEREITLYPQSQNVYFLNEDSCSHMLRVKRVTEGDAILSIGDQVYYEKIARLKNKPEAPELWKNLAGVYCHDVLGKVEVIYREGKLYLSYGAGYETVLQPIGELCFRQKTGPFCYETIEFQADPETGEIRSFLLNEMAFKERNLGSLLPSQGRWGLQRGERFFPLLAVQAKYKQLKNSVPWGRVFYATARAAFCSSGKECGARDARKA